MFNGYNLLSQCRGCAGLQGCAAGGAALHFAAHLLQMLRSGGAHAKLTDAYLGLLKLLGDTSRLTCSTAGELSVLLHLLNLKAVTTLAFWPLLHSHPTALFALTPQPFLCFYSCMSY